MRYAALLLVVPQMRALALAALFLLAGMPAEASDDQYWLFPSDVELSKRLQAYHLNPDPDAALGLLETLDVEKLVADESKIKNRHTVLFLVVYYSQILRNASRERLVEFRSRLRLDTPKELGRSTVFEVALAWSDHAETELILSEFGHSPQTIRGMLPPKPNFYFELEIASTADMYLFWARFFGSGDQKFLKKIVLKLKGWKPRDEIEMELRALKDAVYTGEPGAVRAIAALLLPQAVFNSLASNASRYPVVRDAIVRFQPEEPGLRQPISELIKGLNPVPPK